MKVFERNSLFLNGAPSGRFMALLLRGMPARSIICRKASPWRRPTAAAEMIKESAIPGESAALMTYLYSDRPSPNNGGQAQSIGAFSSFAWRRLRISNVPFVE